MNKEDFHTQYNYIMLPVIPQDWFNNGTLSLSSLLSSLSILSHLFESSPFISTSLTESSFAVELSKVESLSKLFWTGTGDVLVISEHSVSAVRWLGTSTGDVSVISEHSVSAVLWLWEFVSVTDGFPSKVDNSMSLELTS